MGGYEISIPVEMEPTSGIPPCFDFYSNPGPLVGFYDNQAHSFWCDLIVDLSCSSVQYRSRN